MIHHLSIYISRSLHRYRNTHSCERKDRSVVLAVFQSKFTFAPCHLCNARMNVVVCYNTTLYVNNSNQRGQNLESIFLVIDTK